MLRIPYETVPLTDDFTIRKEDYFRKNGGIIFPNPNAPTGVELGMQDVEAIIKANPDVIVVVDEAYVDFGAASALPLIEKYDNLLVVQTFSKSRGMAGMRIGYAMGNPVLIKYLNDVKYSFNSYTMDQTTLALGAAAIADRAYFEETVHKVVETREWTKKELENWDLSSEIRKPTLFSLLIRRFRQQNCLQHSGKPTLSCVTLRSRELTIICVSRSEHRKIWRN